MYKLTNIGLGFPKAPHGPSKDQNTPKLTKAASKWAMSGYILL
jgi:hypothetical protein